MVFYRDTSPKLRREVLERDNYTCVYCGEPAKVVDHMTPMGRGGPTLKGNLAAACHSCNIRKGNKTPDEFMLGKWVRCGPNCECKK